VNERRRTRRRSLPFLRSAVLECDGRPHIVLLSDLSAEGAFLTTRAPIDIPLPTAPRQLFLKMVIPRDSREVRVPCELVWRSDRFDAATGRPSGLAVRFLEVAPEAQRAVEEFALEGFRPSAAPTPAEYYEHRVLERPSVDMIELNRFGRDGWQLVSVLQVTEGYKLVLVRRL
jgi:hypothetical protein